MTDAVRTSFPRDIKFTNSHNSSKIFDKVMALNRYLCTYYDREDRDIHTILRIIELKGYCQVGMPE